MTFSLPVVFFPDASCILIDFHTMKIVLWICTREELQQQCQVSINEAIRKRAQAGPEAPESSCSDLTRFGHGSNLHHFWNQFCHGRARILAHCMNCVLSIPLLGGGIDPITMGERPIQGLDGEETQFFSRVSKRI